MYSNTEGDFNTAICRVCALFQHYR
jgi:hypothetical protein